MDGDSSYQLKQENIARELRRSEMDPDELEYDDDRDLGAMELRERGVPVPDDGEPSAGEMESE